MAFGALAGAALAACPRSERPEEAVRAFLAPEHVPALVAEGRFFETGGPGILRYLGVDVEPAPLTAGAVVTLSHLFEVVEPFGSGARVMVAFETPDGRRVAGGHHDPIEGRVALPRMQPGERWIDRHRVSLPGDLAAGDLDLLVGLGRDETRATLETKPGRSDGRDRLLVARLRVEVAPPPDLPVATVHRASGPIEADGRLDEPSWRRAEILELSDSLGRDVPTRFPTRLRFLYDDARLYVAFEAEDRDITERYTRRDDPIYEHEAVELFVMPRVAAPGLGPYVELQASPTGVIFDASFEGRRRGMRTAWDGGQTVGTHRDGTLNDDAPDRGWVSEWAVPFSRIPGVEAAPKPGEEWRMNAFRIEKHRGEGGLSAEYTAWSPPRVGDFHAVERFGRMRFAAE